MDLKAEYKLCLNDQVVSMEEQDISFVDPYNLATELDLNLDDRQKVKMVSFRAGHLVWLEKALQLPSRSLHRSLQKLPLFQEIKELIGTMKNRNKKGPNARAPTEWKSLVPLKVRNRLLFLRNTTHCVVLGLLGSDGGAGPDEEAETLVWFTNQLQEDLKAWEKPAGPSKAASSASSQVLAEHQEEVEEVLEVLKQHSACQNAWWAPSRNMITVLKKNTKERQEIRVQGLTKKRRPKKALMGHRILFRRPWLWALSTWTRRSLNRVPLQHLALCRNPERQQRSRRAWRRRPRGTLRRMRRGSPQPEEALGCLGASCSEVLHSTARLLGFFRAWS